MILPTHTQRDIRNAAWAAIYTIAYEHKCEPTDVLAVLTEPRRADAPGAQTVTAHQPVVASPAGSDAVAIPAFLHPRPSEAGLPEVTASGSHAPETATKPEPLALHPADPLRSGAAEGNEAETAAPAPNTENVPVHVPLPILARVRKRHEQKPNWTASLIAKDLGLPREMVEAALAGEKEAAR